MAGQGTMPAMAIYLVRLFRIPADTKIAAEEPGFYVDAYTKEQARNLVFARLRELGYKLRSVSHSTHGGFVAVATPGDFVVEDAPPTPPPGLARPIGGWGGGPFGGEGWGSPP